MIEDKKLGLKIAENKEEEFWVKTKEKLGEEIEQNKRIIEMDDWLIENINKKLKGGFK